MERFLDGRRSTYNIRDMLLTNYMHEVCKLHNSEISLKELELLEADVTLEKAIANVRSTMAAIDRESNAQKVIVRRLQVLQAEMEENRKLALDSDKTDSSEKLIQLSRSVDTRKSRAEQLCERIRSLYQTGDSKVDAENCVNVLSPYQGRETGNRGDVGAKKHPAKDLVFPDADANAHIIVGSKEKRRYFKVHALILSLYSSFFRRNFSCEEKWTFTGHVVPGGDVMKVSFSGFFFSLELPHVDPDMFSEVLRFCYTGDLQLTLENVVDMIKIADQLKIPEIKAHCAVYLQEIHLRIAMLKEWCEIDKIEFKTTVDIQPYLDHKDRLEHLNLPTLLYLLNKDNLQVRSEIQVCDMMFRWIKYRFVTDDVMLALLRCIRWSALPLEYVKTTLIGHVAFEVKGDGTDMGCTIRSVQYIRKIIDYYYTHRIPLADMKTSVRPAVGFERCFVCVGGPKKDEVIAVRFQRPDGQTRTDLTPVPPQTKVNNFASSRVYHNPVNGVSKNCNALFVTGMGKRCNEIWKFDCTYGWSRCADMIISRRFHSSVFVGPVLYSCGGETGTKFRVIFDDLEEYNIHTDTSKPGRGRLARAVVDAACVAHRTSIYFFGGRGSDFNIVNHVQRYDTVTNTCHLYDQGMPQGHYSLFPIVCGDDVILLFDTTCFVYHVTNDTWSVRERFKTDVMYFGAALEDGKIYLFGGLDMGIESNRIRCVDVQDVILGSGSAGWQTVGKLPPGYGNVFAYGILSMPYCYCLDTSARNNSHLALEKK